MKKYIIGIDIGGSKISAVLIKNGKVFHRVKGSTPQKGRKEFLDKLTFVVKRLTSKLDQDKLRGIGCGIAGTLDLEKGTILKAPNIEILNNFNIKSWLSKKFKCDVKIDNDARSFARAEYFFGAGKGYKNIVGVTLGTGVGGGIIIDGKMLCGSNGSAGEVGHMIIKVKNQNAKIKTFDLESLVSVKSLKKLGFSDSIRAFNKAVTGDKNAKKAFGELGQYLGIGLANIVNILDPRAIVIGGGLAGAAKFFLPQAKKTMLKLIISPKARKNIKILPGKLGENASSLGAALLF